MDGRRWWMVLGSGVVCAPLLDKASGCAPGHAWCCTPAMALAVLGTPGEACWCAPGIWPWLCSVHMPKRSDGAAWAHTVQHGGSTLRLCVGPAALLRQPDKTGTPAMRARASLRYPLLNPYAAPVSLLACPCGALTLRLPAGRHTRAYTCRHTRAGRARSPAPRALSPRAALLL